MSKRRPRLAVIAGPNGAGKSTSAPTLLRDLLGIREFVNADAIAQGMSGFDPDAAAIAAGRAMLARLRSLADAERDFQPRAIARGGPDLPFEVNDEPTWSALERRFD